MYDCIFVMYISDVKKNSSIYVAVIISCYLCLYRDLMMAENWAEIRNQRNGIHLCFVLAELLYFTKISLHSFYCSLCTIFLSSLTLCNTSSFLTRSVQMIFSNLLQHHISKLSRYFLSNSLCVQVSAPYYMLCSKCST